MSTFLPADIQSSTSQERSKSFETILDLVEYNASVNPENLFCIQARRRGWDVDSPAPLYITHHDLARWIVQLSSWFRRTFPDQGYETTVNDTQEQPIALMMDSDVNLFVAMCSLMGIKAPVLLLSARLSVEAILHLMSLTCSDTIVVSRRLCETAKEVQSERTSGKESMKVIACPTVDELKFIAIEATDWQRTLKNCSFNPNKRDALVLHSSGTTGLPKPSWCSHHYLLGKALCHAFPPGPATERICVSTLPLYHGFGLVAPILSLGIGKPVCFTSPIEPPTGESTVSLIKEFKAGSLVSVPSILEQIVRMPQREGLDALKGLHYVTWGGGLLRDAVGETMIDAGVPLLNSFGITEYGPLSLMFIPTADYDWHYFRLRKDAPLRLETKLAADGSPAGVRMVLRPPGWQEDFVVPDLMERNPRHPKSDLKPLGRTDDTIVMANGEKVNPRILEDMLMEHKSVRSAVAFGAGKSQLGVIVEPFESIPNNRERDFKLSLWPKVKEAGKRMDAFAAITSLGSLVVTSSVGKVLPRSDKGSVLRKQTWKVFEDDIEHAYTGLETQMNDNSYLRLEQGIGPRDVRPLLANGIDFKLDIETWSDDDDFFECGVDSLQATIMQRSIKAAIADADIRNKLPNDLIYQYPSINALCKYLGSLDRSLSETEDRSTALNSLIEHYRLEEQDQTAATTDNLAGKVVLLIGSTGSLGPNLLADLARDEQVSFIICINRRQSQDSRVRQQKVDDEQGIRLSEKSASKIHHIDSDITQPCLGLSEALFGFLCRSISHVVLNAWPVDFKRYVKSFKKQFEGMRRVLQLANARSRLSLAKLQILFVSSIAVIGRHAYQEPAARVEEQAIPEVSWLNPSGYAEAKFVCERLLEEFQKRNPECIDARIVRLGQISGSTCSHLWNVREHFPMIIKLCQKLGRLPQLFGTHAWLPADKAASVIHKIMSSPQSDNCFYHVENPVRHPWVSTMSKVANDLDIPIESSLPYDDWLELIRADQGAAASKAVSEDDRRLLDFFQNHFRRMSCGGVVMDMANAKASSDMLRHEVGLAGVDISQYIAKWKQVGFLQ